MIHRQRVYEVLSTQYCVLADPGGGIVSGVVPHKAKDASAIKEELMARKGENVVAV